MDRRTALAAVAALGLAAPLRAQESAAVRLVVGFPAGGAPDAVARVFAEHLRRATGQQVVVENRVGAGGKIGLDAVLNAPPDGRTLGVVPGSVLALMPQVVRSFRYDVLADFVPLAALAEYGFAIGVGPGAPNGSLGAFLAWAKLNPGRVAYATPGLGTPQHFLGSALAKATGAELTHVPYRGGAPAMTDVLGGQVPALITTEPLLAPQHAAGKLRTLMVTSPRRSPRLPDVPTAREAGFPQLEATDWFGVFAPRGTPAATVDAVRRSLQAVVSRPDYAQAIAEIGYTPSDAKDTRLRERLERDVGAWGARAKDSGFTAAD